MPVERSRLILFAALTLLIHAAVGEAQEKARPAPASAAGPALFIVGDSTVNNTSDGFLGWGNAIGEFFDPSKIRVVNRARGGRSSRTFQTEGLWDSVLSEMKPGDLLLIQFGHNDGGPLDTERARGSLKGLGEETQEVTVQTTGKRETVHTYGWYMRKYVTDAKAKGVVPIVLSQVPRNIWKEGKIERASDSYGWWARRAAQAGGAYFIDLNEIVASKYEKEGEAKTAAYFTTKDHTHTSPAGARLNAESVVEGLKRIKGLPIRKFLSKQK